MIRYAIHTITLALVVFAVSCTTTTEPDDGPAAGTIITKENVHADSAVGWVYYSLDENKEISAAEAGTDKWDIKMAYLRCCGNTRQIDVFLNSGTVGVGTTLGAMVSSRFETLTEIPTSVTPKADDTTMVDRVVPAAVLGADIMFIYEGLPHHTIAVSPDKVLMIVTSSGKIYKFQFTSIYQDSPQTPTQETAMGYYHFRYQQAINGAW